MNVRWTTSLPLAVLSLWLMGCASTDPTNESARPWNSPRGWETGLPSQMFEGR